MTEKELIAARYVRMALAGRPSIGTKAINASLAAARIGFAIIKGVKVVVPIEEQERRISICKSCEQFTGKTCKLCGCFIRLKARLETEHCPIKKW